MERSKDALSAMVRAKMLAAAWLEKSAYDGNQNCPLKWSDLGLRRAMLLRHIIVEFGLGKDTAAVTRFTRMCQEIAPPTACTKAGDPSQGFWIACLEELALDMDDGTLCSFVEVVTSHELADERLTALDQVVSRCKGDQPKGKELTSPV